MGCRLDTECERGDEEMGKMRDRELRTVYTSLRVLVIRVPKSRRVRWTWHVEWTKAMYGIQMCNEIISS
jgi:hypothetical protein